MGGLSPGVKRPGHEADHSPSSSAGVRIGGAIPLLLHTPSWRGAYLSTGTNLRLETLCTPVGLYVPTYKFQSLIKSCMADPIMNMKGRDAVYSGGGG
jgi:hypothetical protein